MKNSKKVFGLIAFIVAVIALYAFCKCGDSNVSRIDEPVDSAMVDSVMTDSVVFDSTTVVTDTVAVDSVK
jgi:hypothetical protein